MTQALLNANTYARTLAQHLSQTYYYAVTASIILMVQLFA